MILLTGNPTRKRGNTSPTRQRGRFAFTLLEVTLAMAVSVLLLAGLYLVMSMQLLQMRSGREIIVQNSLARSLLNRIAGDITGQLAPFDPRTLASSSQQSSSTSESSSSSNPSSDSGSSSTSNTSNTSSTSEASEETLDGTAVFNQGIQGDETHLVLYVHKASRNDVNETGPISELRKVSYWLAGGGEVPLGLARQEVKLATSPEGLSTEVPADEENFIIAPEVAGLMFEYYDGSTWQPVWDGAATLEDGKTPIGPPVAVAITLTIGVPRETMAGVSLRETTLRHVVFLPTANGSGLAGGFIP